MKETFYIIKNLFLLLASVVLLCSCNKGVASKGELNEASDTIVEATQEPWVGAWKLMKASFSGPIIGNPDEELPPLDYSDLNVTFEFKADSVLIVKGRMNHPNWTIGFEESIFNIREGTYTYSIPEQETAHRLYLKIGSKLTYDFVVHDKSMSIGLTGIGSLAFEKVKK
ncbi:MAG: hypothetical protein FWE30_01770 [Bacteroidales bacterium]|nr:hypothetical protein [Bacteroidales bacterium]